MLLTCELTSILSDQCEASFWKGERYKLCPVWSYLPASTGCIFLLVLMWPVLGAQCMGSQDLWFGAKASESVLSRDGRNCWDLHSHGIAKSSTTYKGSPREMQWSRGIFTHSDATYLLLFGSMCYWSCCYCSQLLTCL